MDETGSGRCWDFVVREDEHCHATFRVTKV